MGEPIRVIIDSLPTKDASFFTIFNSLLTPLIAIITVFIAFQQYKTNRLKLKLDLYEKRKRIYTEIDSLINEIIRDADMQPEKSHAFKYNIILEMNLFRKKEKKYINEIYNKAILLWSLNAKIFDRNGNAIQVRDGEKHEDITAKIKELLIWFSDQHKELPGIFNKYFMI